MSGLSEPPCRPGAIVRSLAGRDAGSHYVVVRLVDQQRVQLADGHGRLVEKPKVKNLRHVALSGSVSEDLRVRLERGDRVSNADLQAVLAAVTHMKQGD